MQQLQGPDHGLSRRRGQPVKLHDVVNPHGLQLQHCAGQLTPLHFWHTAIRQGSKVCFCTEPEAEPWSHSAGASYTQCDKLKDCADSPCISVRYSEKVCCCTGPGVIPYWTVLYPTRQCQERADSDCVAVRQRRQVCLCTEPGAKAWPHSTGASKQYDSFRGEETLVAWLSGKVGKSASKDNLKHSPGLALPACPLSRA